MGGTLSDVLGASEAAGLPWAPWVPGRPLFQLSAGAGLLCGPWWAGLWFSSGSAAGGAPGILVVHPRALGETQVRVGVTPQPHGGLVAEPGTSRRPLREEWAGGLPTGSLAPGNRNSSH